MKRTGFHPQLLTDPKQALEFILAGYSIFTLKSKETGVRYTYKVSAPIEELDAQNPLPGMEGIKEERRNYDSKIRMVGLLNGPDNNTNYVFIGVIDLPRNLFRLTRKSRMTSDTVPVQAISWLLTKLAAGRMPTTCEVWHEGRCGHCGKRLTVDESIKAGYGPKCLKGVA